MHGLCENLDRFHMKEGRIALEILQALSRLLGEEPSVVVMVEECDGFTIIENLQISEADDELKEKGRLLLDCY